MAVYTFRNAVMFQHCDPAGIVFYPRYFEMINEVVETMFRDALDWPFAQMHVRDRTGVPMGRIATEFHAASRLGDVLDWTLAVTRIGGASLDAVLRAQCDVQARLTAHFTLVYVDLDRMRSVRWPEDKRAMLAHFMEDAA
ncbi:acyl-CoA thioesterase [Roseivivax sp. CAU 1753]